MRKILYDVAVKGEGGKWYPFAVVSTKAKAQQAYQDFLALGGIKGELLIIKRIHDLYLTH